MITTVVFDLDDTLYDEIDYCRSGFKAVSRFLAQLPGCPPAAKVFDALWLQFNSGNRTRTFNAALDSLALRYDQRLIDKLVEVYRTHLPDIDLPADSKDLLERLQNKYQLALLTDGFLPAQRLKVQALGIVKSFKAIIYTELLGRDCWKPSPIGFEKLLAALNALPQETVYIADNEAKDFIAPNKLGLRTIRLIRPASIHRQPSDQPAAKPAYIINHLAELPPLLEKL